MGKRFQKSCHPYPKEDPRWIFLKFVTFFSFDLLVSEYIKTFLLGSKVSLRVPLGQGCLNHSLSLRFNLTTALALYNYVISKEFFVLGSLDSLRLVLMNQLGYYYLQGNFIWVVPDTDFAGYPAVMAGYPANNFAEYRISG